MNRKFLSFLALLAFANFYGCKKTNGLQMETPPIISGITNLKFFLFTTRDFSNSTDRINFRMYIRNGQEVLLDSSLLNMQVKDIPNAANQLVFERIIPANEQGIFTVGFVYDIENVGVSWHLDTCRAGNPDKIISFNFM